MIKFNGPQTVNSEVQVIHISPKLSTEWTVFIEGSNEVSPSQHSPGKCLKKKKKPCTKALCLPTYKLKHTMRTDLFKPFPKEWNINRHCPSSNQNELRKHVLFRLGVQRINTHVLLIQRSNWLNRLIHTYVYNFASSVMKFCDKPSCMSQNVITVAAKV